MKKKEFNTLFFTIKVLSLCFFVITLSACVGDQSLAKRKGFVKDFSKDQGSQAGCVDSFLIYTAPYDTCTPSCLTGTHVSSLEELSKIKQDLVAAGANLINGVAADTLLQRVNASSNLCVADVIKDVRPTKAISIKNDFCSCINGKADILSDCDTTCSLKPVTSDAFLYVNTTVGPEIALNTKLGNVYNWCTVQLSSDDVSPQCTITATDGNTTVTLPPVISPGSNSFSVNITTLAKNRTWIIKINEFKTGSNAESKEFQIIRKNQPTDTSLVGALKISPVNQYTCMTYGGTVDSTGNIIRTNYTRLLYYYAANEMPAPILPPGGNSQSLVVCHDEQLHPGKDSVEYDRLELIPGALALFDKADIRFTAKAENAGKLTINKILEERLLSEYQITSSGSGISLFYPLNFPNRPSTDGVAAQTALLGFAMIPFTASDTGKAYCPNSSHFTGNQPLLNLLGEYMGDTEGLFLAEKEGEMVFKNGSYVPVYGTMLTKESTLLNYGFYVQNGLKIRADSSSLNTKTIYFYWPLSTTADALTQGNRKLFTVRTFDTLNGQTISGAPTTERTSDKRIGCIPKI